MKTASYRFMLLTDAHNWSALFSVELVPLVMTVGDDWYPWNRWTRPVPESLVNSASSSPTLRNRHSTASECPVAIANSGMFPSLLLRGSRVRSLLVMAVDTQGATVGM